MVTFNSMSSQLGGGGGGGGGEGVGGGGEPIFAN